MTSALRTWKVIGSPLRGLLLRSNSFEGKLTGRGSEAGYDRKRILNKTRVGLPKIKFTRQNVK